MTKAAASMPTTTESAVWYCCCKRHCFVYFHATVVAGGTHTHANNKKTAHKLLYSSYDLLINSSAFSNTMIYSAHFSHETCRIFSHLLLPFAVRKWLHSSHYIAYEHESYIPKMSTVINHILESRFSEQYMTTIIET